MAARSCPPHAKTEIETIVGQPVGDRLPACGIVGGQWQSPRPSRWIATERHAPLLTVHHGFRTGRLHFRNKPESQEGSATVRETPGGFTAAGGLKSTVHYPGIGGDDALEILAQIEI
jgi:hypothetical protein